MKRVSEPNDGAEIKLDAELTFGWVEGDRSVGIDSGCLPISLTIGSRSYDLEYVPGEGLRLSYEDSRRIMEKAAEAFFPDPLDDFDFGDDEDDYYEGRS